jgi:oligopeptide/dipeptide ABC transporter ATP-binding protein
MPPIPTPNEELVRLSVKDLKTFFFLDEGLLKAVNGVSFNLRKSEVIGIIGESGCGKSVLVRSLINIIRKPGYIISGSIKLIQDDGNEVNIAKLKSTDRKLRKIRGREISIIFQEPMTSLSPVHTVGSQILESLLLHQKISVSEAKEATLEMINAVGIPNPGQRYHEYPYQLSGGMRQRIMIGMALSCNPKILIADEPTTALDVTVQAQILDLIGALKDKYETSIVYITHDLGVIAETSDIVCVMYLGKIVEMATTKEIFSNPQHPYTQALMKSIPRIDKGSQKLDPIEGNVPIPINLPWQCSFYNRCKFATSRCANSVPSLQGSDYHKVSCFMHSSLEEKTDEWSRI